MTPLEWLRDETGTGAGLAARVDWPRLLLVALSIAVLVGLAVAAATSTAAFSPYNPSWDGTSDLREGVDADPALESELVRETTRYDAVEPADTVAFVVAPAEPYDSSDAERVRQFVENGGTLVVLENVGSSDSRAGSGNDLLADVGATARVDGTLLRDERTHYRGPAMPVATGVATHALTDGVDQLTLNYPSSLEPGEATVLVRTSESAYRDRNRNGELGDREEPGSYPVATTEPVADGRVIVVGDPSIAVNAMLEEPDNEAFLRALSADADRVLFDLSHTDELPPLAAATLTLRETPALQLLVGTLGIGAIAVGSRRRVWPLLARIRSLVPWSADPETAVTANTRSGFDDERRASTVRQCHPEWDDQRIGRVIAALNRDDSELEDDE